MMSEFRDFAMRGNVVDMAVGIVIGGAFGTQTLGTERLGECNEVRVQEIGGVHAAAVHVALHRPHVPVGVVVEHDRDHADPVLHRSRELGCRVSRGLWNPGRVFRNHPFDSDL